MTLSTWQDNGSGPFKDNTTGAIGAAISSVERDVPTITATVVKLISVGSPVVSLSAYGPHKAAPE